MIDRTKLFDLLLANKLCVLSTLHSDGSPQSAVVGFTETRDLKFIIGTSKDSRKAKNIKGDDRVSMVIGWDQRITLQLEGCVEVLTEVEFRGYLDAIKSKNPISAKYLENPDQVYIRVSPKWMRYTDLNFNPWLIQEEDIS